MNDKKNFSGNAVHELAPLYVLGGLDAHDKIRFEEHLRLGCEICSLELRSLEEVASALGRSVPADPPAGLRDRLLARVSRTPRVPGRAYEENGLLIAHSEEISWRTMAPGISYKPLYRDADRKSDTMLVRMDAGARYPSHHHVQVEELFLLSGDLHVEGQVMYAGDYCRASLGSVHDQSYTDSGCVFLLLASPDNQVLA